MKKKVLIIVENNPFPHDLRVRYEATALHANGYEVTVLSPRGKGFERGHEIIAGIHVYRHPMPSWGDSALGHLLEYSSALFWQFVYAVWIYLCHHFHVIQGCNPPDDIFLVALPFRLLGVSYIFDHHDVCPELYLSIYDRKGILYRLQCWLERLTFKSSDVVLSTNSSYRDIATGRGGMDPRDVFVVRNGPNLDRVRPAAPNTSLKRGKRYLVGYVGVMGVQEGLDFLVAVAAYIKNSGRHDIHFACVGKGSQLAALQELVHSQGLDDTLTFTGPVSDEELMTILSTADICVNPDTPCAMNNLSTMIKIMEYMALGKPIVQFDLKEGRVSAGEASLYVDKDKGVPGFAEKIEWLLDRPDERRRMGELGRQRVEHELKWEHSVRHLLAAYDRAFYKARRNVNCPCDFSSEKAIPSVPESTKQKRGAFGG